MKPILAIMVAAALCLGTGVAHAQKAPPPLKKRVMKELGLNDQQIQKIEDLTYKADRAKLEIQHEVQKAHFDLQHLMSKDKPSKSEVFSQLEKLSALELKMKKNRVGLMLEIRTLLTAEQWEKLEMFQAERKHNRRERWQRRRQMRYGGTTPDAPPPPDEPAPPDAPPVP
jgi:Spy/CpxP family protein refolding chaperone